jgi:hypothetical protein
MNYPLLTYLANNILGGKKKEKENKLAYKITIKIFITYK